MPEDSDQENDPFNTPLPKPNPSSEGVAQIPEPPSVNEDYEKKRDDYNRDRQDRPRKED